jgi:hypothetical protein
MERQAVAPPAPPQAAARPALVWLVPGPRRAVPDPALPEKEVERPAVTAPARRVMAPLARRRAMRAQRQSPASVRPAPGAAPDRVRTARLATRRAPRAARAPAAQTRERLRSLPFSPRSSLRSPADSCGSRDGNASGRHRKRRADTQRIASLVPTTKLPGAVHLPAIDLPGSGKLPLVAHGRQMGTRGPSNGGIDRGRAAPYERAGRGRARVRVPHRFGVRISRIS